MIGLISALLVFALVAAIIRGIEGAASTTTFHDDVPRRPQPSVRDRHATTGTLHRAHVPRFG